MSSDTSLPIYDPALEPSTVVAAPDLERRQDEDMHFRFLDLTAELRNNVYEYSAIDETHITPVHTVPDKYDYRFGRDELLQIVHGASSGAPSLAKACRQIRFEFLPLFHNKIPLRIPLYPLLAQRDTGTFMSYKVSRKSDQCPLRSEVCVLLTRRFSLELWGYHMGSKYEDFRFLKYDLDLGDPSTGLLPSVRCDWKFERHPVALEYPKLACYLRKILESVLRQHMQPRQSDSFSVLSFIIALYEFAWYFERIQERIRSNKDPHTWDWNDEEIDAEPLEILRAREEE